MEHIIEEEYMTDELDSGAEDDSCDDRPNVVRFNEEDEITKEFIFKVGMELSSLKQFKSDILEHYVLNGRDVIFGGKKLMQRGVWLFVRTKELCNYTVLCNRVLTSTTFRMKT